MTNFETIDLSNLSNVTGGAHNAESNGRIIGMAGLGAAGAIGGGLIGGPAGAVAGAGLGMAAGAELGGYIGEHWG